MSKVKGVARLLVNAQQASPSPALGQALGPLGVNMAEFCKTFNARTANIEPGVPIPVSLTAFSDRTFKYDTKVCFYLVILICLRFSFNYIKTALFFYCIVTLLLLLLLLLLQTPPTAWFLKRLTGIVRGSAKPGQDFNGTVNVKQIYEIAKVKVTDPHLQHIPLESMCRSIIGTAKSMGIKVITSGDDTFSASSNQDGSKKLQTTKIDKKQAS